MTDIITEDWKEFGYRERKKAIKLLTLYIEGMMTVAASDHMANHPRAALNKRSGYVFITDDEANAFLDNAAGKLDIWLNCPQCGNEGFPATIVEDPRCDHCVEFARYYVPDNESGKTDWADVLGDLEALREKVINKEHDKSERLLYKMIEDLHHWIQEYMAHGDGVI